MFDGKKYLKIFLISLAIALVVVIVIFAVRIGQKTKEKDPILDNSSQSKEESSVEKQLRELDEIGKRLKENGGEVSAKSPEDQLKELDEIGKKIGDKKTGSVEEQLEELENAGKNQNQ